jgi:AraC-like DNA-binding protein
VSCLRLDVLAHLTPPLLAHLRVVLGAHHTVTAPEDWPAFQLAALSPEHDVIVADPYADGMNRAPELAEFVVTHPWTPLVIYTAVTPAALKAVATLANVGAQQLILYRYDDEPRRFAEILERQPGHALSAALLHAFGPGLDTLTPALARAIEHLFRRPVGFDTAGNLASSADLTVRTVYRQLAAAGFESPRRLIVGARLLRAYAYARDPEQSLEEVARRLGYSAPRMLTRHMREIVGITPRAARRRMPAQEFVSILAARLYNATNTETTADARTDTHNDACTPTTTADLTAATTATH